jgi:hypothetical protein
VEPGSYFTDGVSLFRFEELLPRGLGVLLEDASTERVWWVPKEELKSMDLKPVAPLVKGVEGLAHSH